MILAVHLGAAKCGLLFVHLTILHYTAKIVYKGKHCKFWAIHQLDSLNS